MNEVLERRRHLRRPTQVLLADMQEHAKEALQFADGVSFSQSVANNQLRWAIERQLEIIGKAASLVPRRFRDDHPEVPWHEIVERWRCLIVASSKADDGETWQAAIGGMSALVAALDPLITASN